RAVDAVGEGPPARPAVVLGQRVVLRGAPPPRLPRARGGQRVRGWLAIGTAVALQALSCGGDPPICPNGDCSLPGRTTVKSTLDHYPEWLVMSDSCLDMGAAEMRGDRTGIDCPTFMKPSNDPV